MYKIGKKLQKVNVGPYLRGAVKMYIYENLTAQRSAGLYKKLSDKTKTP